jgi:3-dehydroquinate synthase
MYHPDIYGLSAYIMKKQNITVDLNDRSYDIIIAPNGLETSQVYLNSFIQNKKCFIISDSNVFPLYGGQIIAKLKQSKGIISGHYVFPAGESSKTLSTVEQIYHAALKYGLDRSSVIIALGGGVVGDIAGFVAATYMRGIDFIQIPTSLLAMVDSSVGGKTGVDMPEGKNLVGAFWQPKLVLIDPEMLHTLPEREIKGGLSEVVKYGVILDSSFFDKLADETRKINSIDSEFYSKIIAECCKLKAGVVKQDEQETGLRGILNYGHTFGHAIETVSKYEKYIHGEAVGIGMLMAGELACLMKKMERIELNKLISLYRKLNLCISVDGIDADAVFEAMRKDKKVRDGNVCFVLPEQIGKVSFEYDVDKNLVIDAIKKYIEFK